MLTIGQSPFTFHEPKQLDAIAKYFHFPIWCQDKADVPSAQCRPAVPVISGRNWNRKWQVRIGPRPFLDINQFRKVSALIDQSNGLQSVAKPVKASDRGERVRVRKRCGGGDRRGL